MATPGSFTSGQVLTAAEMNALPAGVLDYEATTSDYTITSSLTDTMNITFTVADDREVYLYSCFPLLSGQSGSPTYAFFYWQDGNAASVSPTLYGQFYADVQNLSSVTAYCRTTFAAGTHTVYLVGQTNTGSVTLDGAGAANRRNQLTAFDMGPT